MGIFNKNRKDAFFVKPKDSVQAIVPYLMPNRTEAEVSNQVVVDITELCKFVDQKNASGNLDYKMTYFHALIASFGMTIYNRPDLNRFVKNKRLYQRKKLTFAFVAKNKMSDAGEERLVCVELNPKETGMQLSHKIAVEVFQVKKDGKNDMEGILKVVTSLPKWLLTIVFGFVKFLDKHGWAPNFLTEGDTNYASVLVSNLGSIKAGSCYHHLNNYGTNSIMLTIGTIREEKGHKIVDLQFTLDERIADGFYFAHSIQLLEQILKHPELLEQVLSTKIEF